MDWLNNWFLLPKVQAFCHVRLEDYYVLHTVNMFYANIYTLIFKPNVMEIFVPITSILSHQQRNMLVIKKEKKEKKGAMQTSSILNYAFS